MDANIFWYSLSFVIHFGALAMTVGAGICDAVLNVVMWRRLHTDPDEAAALAPLMGILGDTAAIGGWLALASGVSLLASMQLADWGSLWLNLKLVLFVLLTANGMMFARSRKKRVVELTREWSLAWRQRPGSFETSGASAPAASLSAASWRAALPRQAEIERELGRLRQHLGVFHIAENAGFLAILVLAVFKFG